METPPRHFSWAYRVVDIRFEAKQKRDSLGHVAVDSANQGRAAVLVFRLVRYQMRCPSDADSKYSQRGVAWSLPLDWGTLAPTGATLAPHWPPTLLPPPSPYWPVTPRLNVRLAP